MKTISIQHQAKQQHLSLIQTAAYIFSAYMVALIIILVVI